jgi:hypothetical protein
MSNFREKYLKYKSKYFELKNLVGGSLNITINNESYDIDNIKVSELKNKVHTKYPNYLPVNQIMKLQCDGAQQVELVDDCNLEAHGITNGSKIILENRISTPAKKYTIREMREILNRPSTNFPDIKNNVVMPANLKETDIPKEFVDKSEMNARSNNFETILNKLGDLNNILFINISSYTNPMVKLLDKGIDMRIQLYFYQYHIEASHDILPQIENKNITNNTSLGIVVNPYDTINNPLEHLPKKETIEKYKFRKIVIIAGVLFNNGKKLENDMITTTYDEVHLPDGTIVPPPDEKFVDFKDMKGVKQFYKYIEDLNILTESYGISTGRH